MTNLRAQPQIIIATMETTENRLRTLALAFILSIGLMLLASLNLAQGLAVALDGRVVGAIVEQIWASPDAVWAVFQFAAKVFALYASLAVVVWVSANLTTLRIPALAQYRYLTVAAWLVLLGLTVGLANADLYPWSKTGRWSRGINHLLGGNAFLWTGMACLIVACWAYLLGCWIASKGRIKLAARALIWSLIALSAAATFGMTKKLLLQDHPANEGHPNVVLVGIDSLRPELVGRIGSLGYAPSLSSFANSGHRFTDAVTPLARTYPSWMAMLTGRRPAHTGIRENLMPRSAVHETTLAELLAREGYQTIYATDEVRFSNIDTTYGFEQSLTPTIGASDFILGGIADFPLYNLIANTWFGEWLFPGTFANRALATTYDPQSFVDRVRRGVSPDGRPLFLAMHLTLPHWPYRWREDTNSVLSSTSDSAYAYLSAAITADKQFAAMLKVLEDKGLLKNSLVIAFSDHGEGLNLLSENLTRFVGKNGKVGGIPMWLGGHGTSVLSAAQFQIFLAAKIYDRHGTEGSSSVDDRPVSIEDIAPTVLDYIGSTSTHQPTFDGWSFADELTNSTKAASVAKPFRVRFTESAYSTPSLRQGAANEQSLLEEGANAFRVNPNTGWVEIKTELWPELMAVRERAAIGKTQLLASVPTAVPGVSNYLLVPRTGGQPAILSERPTESPDSEAAILWDALISEYGSELGTPSTSTHVTSIAGSFDAPSGRL